MRLVLASSVLFSSFLATACTIQTAPAPQGPAPAPYPDNQPPPQQGGAPVGQIGFTGQLTPYNGPVQCNGSEDFAIENADINVQGPAVMVNGSCTISIRNSRVTSSGGPALLVSGSGEILISYSYVAGQPPIIVSGSGLIRAEASQIEGDVFVSGSGDVDLRGNLIRGRTSVTGTGDIQDNGNQWQ
jgi:hypothetical protein